MKPPVAIFAAVALSLSGCSSTPGDAARAGGHVQQGAELYKKGAAQGDGEAARKLGHMILSDEVSAEIYGSAVTWFVKGCELEDAIACHNAGVAYEYGPAEGHPEVTPDHLKAHDYYLQAANLGYMQSQYNLGSMYSNGYFDNDIAGLKWLLLAQTQARECNSASLCRWILEDPPGHVSRLRARMSVEAQTEAESQAREPKGKE